MKRLFRWKQISPLLKLETLIATFWVPETTKRPRCITVSENGSLKMMKEENKSLRTGLKWAEMEALKQNQTNAAGEMSEVTEKVIKANREVDQLLRRNIKLETQSRRNNIKFF